MKRRNLANKYYVTEDIRASCVLCDDQGGLQPRMLQVRLGGRRWLARGRIRNGTRARAQFQRCGIINSPGRVPRNLQCAHCVHRVSLVNLLFAAPATRDKCPRISLPLSLSLPFSRLFTPSRSGSALSAATFIFIGQLFHTSQPVTLIEFICNSRHAALPFLTSGTEGLFSGRRTLSTPAEGWRGSR